MRYYYINDNDRFPKRYFSNGRLIIRGENGTRLAFEWSVPSKRLGIKLSLNDEMAEEAISLSINLWLVSLYISLENTWLSRQLEKITWSKTKVFGYGRSIGITFYAEYLWIDLWNPEEDYEAKRFWWQHISIDLHRLIKGKPVISEVIVDERDVLVPMPEGNYKAHAKLLHKTWTYPRWFTQEISAVDLEFKKGVPHEGKGENSWDCGPDATTGFYCPANSIADGVGKFVGSSLATRIKNGGWDDWKWEKGKK